MNRLVRPNRPGLKAALRLTGICVLAAAVGVSAIRMPAEENVDAGNGKAKPAPKSPISPEESLAHFELHPGLKIELVAAEPDVIDPVAIAFDEDGRLWVVEMIDYPNGPKEGESPRSRIRILEDTDGDGRYDSSRVFADNLLFVNGVQPWRGGVIVTLAGEVAGFRLR
jgi:glucose/arabinose dehydrogenase